MLKHVLAANMLEVLRKLRPRKLKPQTSDPEHSDPLEIKKKIDLDTDTLVDEKLNCS